MSEKILMRNEVLEGGAPLPLMSLLEVQGNGLTIEDERIKAIWGNAISDMQVLVRAHFPGVEPVMSELWELEKRKAEKVKNVGGYVVTMDSYDPTGAYALGVSRHFEPGGTTQVSQAPIGERPGYPPLPQQLQTIKEAAGSQPLLVIEDDMFTGGTAKVVLDMMRDEGLHVNAFVPGLQASSVDSLNGVPVLPIEIYPSGVLNIVDPRDLLFGLPDAGLAIRENTPGTASGYTLYRAPYCLPFVDVAERTSVDVNAAEAFSLGVVDLNEKFFTELEQCLGKKIYVRDLAPEFQTFVGRACPKLPGVATIGEFCVYTRKEILNYQHDAGHNNP